MHDEISVQSTTLDCKSTRAATAILIALKHIHEPRDRNAPLDERTQPESMRIRAAVSGGGSQRRRRRATAGGRGEEAVAAVGERWCGRRWPRRGRRSVRCEAADGGGPRAGFAAADGSGPRAAASGGGGQRAGGGAAAMAGGRAAATGERRRRAAVAAARAPASGRCSGGRPRAAADGGGGRRPAGVAAVRRWATGGSRWRRRPWGNGGRRRRWPVGGAAIGWDFRNLHVLQNYCNPIRNSMLKFKKIKNGHSLFF